jgi:hypothetical protein
MSGPGRHGPVWASLRHWEAKPTRCNPENTGTGAAGDPDWSNAHYQMVAEYGLHLMLVGLLSASALLGWRFTGWCTASMAGVMGAGFIVFPHSQSSGGVGWDLG